MVNGSEIEVLSCITLDDYVNVEEEGSDWEPPSPQVVQTRKESPPQSVKTLVDKIEGEKSKTDPLIGHAQSRGGSMGQDSLGALNLRSRGSTLREVIEKHSKKQDKKAGFSGKRRFSGTMEEPPKRKHLLNHPMMDRKVSSLGFFSKQEVVSDVEGFLMTELRKAGKVKEEDLACLKHIIPSICVPKR